MTSRLVSSLHRAGQGNWFPCELRNYHAFSQFRCEDWTAPLEEVAGPAGRSLHQRRLWPSGGAGWAVRAFLLAGGRGERLRPVTLSRPKCLVPINGVPLLGIWLDLCAREGVGDVLLNVSHHADLVRDYLARWSGPPRVKLVVEAEPYGTAGTVSLNRSFVESEESFWVLYADNLTDVSLADMRVTHRRHDGILTMGLFHAPVPTTAGIVQLDRDGRIIAFDEKPTQPRGDLANAGIYLARSKLFEEMPNVGEGILDFGFHVLPALVGRMYGHVIEQFLMDIGTAAALADASAAWSRERGRAER